MTKECFGATHSTDVIHSFIHSPCLVGKSGAKKKRLINGLVGDCPERLLPADHGASALKALAAKVHSLSRGFATEIFPREDS